MAQGQVIPGVGEDVTHLMGGTAVPGIGEDVTHLMGSPAPAATPPPGLSPHDVSISSGAERFGEGFLRTNPLSTVGSLVGGLLSDPRGTVEQAVFAPVAREAGLARQAAQQGRPAAAVGHALGAIPLVGPPIAATIERAASGDVAGAAGEATGMGMTMGLVKPTVEAVGSGAAELGRKVPGVSDAMTAVGNRAERVSTRKMAQAIAPTGGANRANLTAVAQRIAPDLARSPELSGVALRGGLQEAVHAGLEQARAGLDEVHDQALMQSLHATAPIIKGLQDEQGKLLVHGANASVLPSADAETQFEILQGLIDKVKQLGPTANYANLRALRQAWDAPAAAAKIYAKTPAEFSQKLTGQAYANGAGVVREYLGTKSPQAAEANARYALYANADKVLRAQENASLTQAPGIGRSLVTRATGYLAGKATGGGVPAELIGTIVAPLLDQALSSAKVGVKVRTAQHFAALADALRDGNQTTIAQRVQALKAQLGPMRTTVKLGAVGGRFVGQPPPSDQRDQQAATPPPAPAAATPPPR